MTPDRTKAADGPTRHGRQRRSDALDELHQEWVAGVDQNYVARAAQIQAMPKNDEKAHKFVSYEDELGLGSEDEPVRHIIPPKQLAEELEILWIKSNLPRTTPNETKIDDKTSPSEPKYSEAQTETKTQTETQPEKSDCKSKKILTPEYEDDFLGEIVVWGINKLANEDSVDCEE